MRTKLRIILYSSFTICFIQTGNAQTNMDLPENKYPRKPRTTYHMLRQYNHGYSSSLFFGYHQTFFLNDFFAQQIKKENISISPGIYGTYRLEVLFPFIAEVSWYSSRFKVSDENYTFPDDTQIRHRGGELAAMLALLPSSRFLVPYFGLGYQYGTIVVGRMWYQDPYQHEDTNETYYTLADSKTSTPIWKCGFVVSFDKRWRLNAEYKQSVKTNMTKSFNQISFGFGFRIL